MGHIFNTGPGTDNGTGTGRGLYFLFATFLIIICIYSSNGDLNTLPQVTITEYAGSEAGEEGGNESSHGINGTEESSGSGLEVQPGFTVVSKPFNSDVIVGEDTKGGRSLLLSCIASYPVQWVYFGDGRPELSTNTSIKFLPPEADIPRANSPFDFTAFAYIANPREKNTGNYTCRSLQDPRVAVYYFLFVPGPTLFTSSGGHDVPYKREDSNIRIPCSVSNPKALVGLQKSVNGLLNCPLNESISYNPRTGFNLRAKDFPDPSGTYICTAAHNNTVRYIEFNLTTTDAPQTPSEIPQEIPNDPEIESEIQNNQNPSTVAISTTTTAPTTATTTTKATTTTTTTTPTSILGTTTMITTSPVHVSKACRRNKDCPDHQSCIEFKCADPCDNICGLNGKCRVINHIPECYCPDDLIGDPYFLCRPKTSSNNNNNNNNNQSGQGHGHNQQGHASSQGYPASNPCIPNPCGDYGECRMSGKVLTCTCAPGSEGTPPNCSPKRCLMNSECPPSEACLQRICNNPCITGVCGKNANCRVLQHSPVCSCGPGFEGDPFDECRPHQMHTHSHPHSSSAVPESIQTNNANPMKSPSPPPCQTLTCGRNAQCAVLSDGRPICQCDPGNNRGDPYAGCYRESDLVHNPCLSSPCGPNTICREATNGSATCICNPGMLGNPYVGCRRQSCLSHRDCQRDQVCYDQRCVDGCSLKVNRFRDSCGDNAICRTEDHSPMCFCKPGFTGAPEKNCFRITRPVNVTTAPPSRPPQSLEEGHPCNPSPCGRNAECSLFRGRALCRCPSPLQGDPVVSCELRCQRTNQCPGGQVCYAGNSTCVDPCLIYDTGCGASAVCKVSNHIPNCYCPSGYEGNPFNRCTQKVSPPGSGQGTESVQHQHQNQNQNHNQNQHEESPAGVVPCHPLPCGPNAVCLTQRDRGTTSSTCACKTGYYGDPFVACQNGHGCTVDNDCPLSRGCISGRCLDPCQYHGVCGLNQDCQAVNHKPTCYCKHGYPIKVNGNCYKDKIKQPSLPDTVNTPRPPMNHQQQQQQQQQQQNQQQNQQYPRPPSQQYPHNPYPHPPMSQTQTHRPPSASGSGQGSSHGQQQQSSCAACGPYSDCQTSRGITACSCRAGMVGSPPNCRPECQYDGQCAFDKACINFRCQDPCAGACGQNALCRVRQRTPVCTCPKGYYGNPVYGCKCCDHSAAVRTGVSDQDDVYDDEELFDSTFKPRDQDNDDQQHNSLFFPVIHFTHNQSLEIL